MAVGSVRFHREHALYALLAAERVRRGSWDAAASAFITRLTAAGPADLHVYFERRCAQSCEFCAQPAQRDRPAPRALTALSEAADALTGGLVDSGAFAALVSACAARPVALTVTGHDWLAHPSREAILDALLAHPAVPVRLLGPSTALEDEALARRVAALPGLRAVALTLQSADPDAHDRMVGRPGAFHALSRAIAALQGLGAPVEVNVVLTAEAVARLPETLRWLAARGLGAHLAAFAPEPALPNPAPLFPRAEDLLAALAPFADRDPPVVLAIVGAPLCAVPVRLRAKVSLGPAIVRGDAPACRRCALRDRCAGVSVEYLRARGDAMPALADAPGDT